MLWLKMASSSWLFGPCFNHFFFVFCSRLVQFACQLCSCWWEESDECYGSKWQAHPGYLDLASIISSLSFALGSSNLRVNSAPVGGKPQMNAMAQNGKLILVIWTLLQSFLLCLLL